MVHAVKSAIRFCTAIVLLGAFYSPAYASHLKDLQAKAATGDAQAQFELGVAYDRGDGTRTDATQAAHWYQLAADQGNAAAQNSLGSLYQAGQGVPLDEHAALQWYEKAAAQGYGEAYTNLGFLYDLGKGVTQDRVKANELYLKGAEALSANAMLNLGLNLWDGQGIEADRVEAYKWLDLARFYSQSSPDRRTKWRVRGVLDDMHKSLTPDQLKEAERRADEWDKAHRPK
jgi:uncharacterized protein